MCSFLITRGHLDDLPSGHILDQAVIQHAVITTRGWDRAVSSAIISAVASHGKQPVLARCRTAVDLDLKGLCYASAHADQKPEVIRKRSPHAGDPPELRYMIGYFDIQP